MKIFATFALLLLSAHAQAEDATQLPTFLYCQVQDDAGSLSERIEISKGTISAYDISPDSDSLDPISMEKYEARREGGLYIYDQILPGSAREITLRVIINSQLPGQLVGEKKLGEASVVRAAIVQKGAQKPTRANCEISQY